LSIDTVSMDRISGLMRAVLSLPTHRVLDLHPEALRGRADVFPMAVLILHGFMKWGGFEYCVLSPRSLLHGVAAEMLEQRNNRPQPPS
jgi:hypothetical protein